MGKSTKLKQEKAAAFEEQLASRLTSHNKSFKKIEKKKGGHWSEFLPAWANDYPMVRPRSYFVAKSFNKDRNRKEILKHCFEKYKIPHSLFSAMVEETDSFFFRRDYERERNERGNGYVYERYPALRPARELYHFLSWAVAIGAGKSFYKTFGKEAGYTKAECHWFTNHPSTITEVPNALRWAMCKARNVTNTKVMNAIVNAKGNWSVSSWVDFFVKNEVESVETVNDLLDFLFAHNDIDLSGRTLASVTNLMNDWHMTLALSKQRDIEWKGVDIDDWEYVEDSGKQLMITAKQLNDTKSLIKEGRQMHHCVGGYVSYCQKGFSAIWAFGAGDNEHAFERVTIEMKLPGRSLVQVRGPWNKTPSKFMQKCVNLWVTKGMRKPKYFEKSLDMEEKVE